MELITELPLIQQVLTGAAFVAAIVLVVLARRQKAAGTGVAPAPAAASRPAKGSPKTSRRRRRKLAQEAAAALGTEAPPATAAVVVPPVEVAPEAPVAEPVDIPADVADVAIAPAHVVDTTPPEAPEPVAAAPEDPYVSEPAAPFPMDEVEGPGPVSVPASPEAIVADPGWPTPGELASGFDPDVFDPLPDFSDEPFDDDAPQAPEPEQPTGVIDISSDDAWVDDFDPATGWAETDADEEVPEVRFDGAEDLVVVAPLADEVWEEPEADWEPDTAAAAAPADDPIGPVDELPELEWEPDHLDVTGEDPVPVAVAAATHEADASAYADEWSPDGGVWPAHDADEAPTGASDPDSITARDVAVSQEPVVTTVTAHSSPVVLDLAGLAATGRALELVIEPTCDGQGVRLRIGPPATPAADGDPNGADHDAAEPVWDPDDMGSEVAEEPYTPWGTVDIEEPADAEPAPATDDDVPFLTGGPSTVVAADAPEWDGSRSAETDDLPSDDADAPEPPLEDPAKILADIRARLADLDARRAERA